MKKTQKTKIWRVALISILSIIWFASLIFSSDAKNEQLANWKDFRAEYGQNWNVLWNEETRTPSLIYGSKQDL